MTGRRGRAFPPDARVVTTSETDRKARYFNKGTLVKPYDRHEPGNCKATSEILARIGDKWTVLVVVMLRDGPMRFNEMRRAIGSISQRMLIERDGFVTRTVFPTVPAIVEYELPTLG